MHKLTSHVSRHQTDPCNLLHTSIEPVVDLDLIEMFTNNLLTEDDTAPHHRIADLSGGLELDHQEATQEHVVPTPPGSLSDRRAGGG